MTQEQWLDAAAPLLASQLLALRKSAAFDVAQAARAVCASAAFADVALWRRIEAPLSLEQLRASLCDTRNSTTDDDVAAAGAADADADNDGAAKSSKRSASTGGGKSDDSGNDALVSLLARNIVASLDAALPLCERWLASINADYDSAGARSLRALLLMSLSRAFDQVIR